jgi:hypothetical protein
MAVAAAPDASMVRLVDFILAAQEFYHRLGGAYATQPSHVKRMSVLWRQRGAYKGTSRHHPLQINGERHSGFFRNVR